MAKSDEQEASSSSNQVTTTKISELSNGDCKITIDEMCKNFIICMSHLNH